jgi:hypothetical protein
MRAIFLSLNVQILVWRTPCIVKGSTGHRDQVADTVIEAEGTTVPEEAPSSRLPTTLYDLIAALQEVEGADDALVVTTVVHLLRSGQLTWRGPSRGPRGLSQCVARGARPRTFPQGAEMRTWAPGQR